MNESSDEELLESPCLELKELKNLLIKVCDSPCQRYEPECDESECDECDECDSDSKNKDESGFTVYSNDNKEKYKIFQSLNYDGNFTIIRVSGLL